MRIALIRAVALLFLTVVTFPATAEAPLHIRNLAPVASLYGVPRAVGAEVLQSGMETTFSSEFVNNWISDTEGKSVAFFDGETTFLTYGIRKSLGERWELGIELPYVIHQGGYFDRTIDGFHSTFGFDDYGRNLASRGNIDYYVVHDGEVAVDFQSDKEGWGDVRAQAGYQLRRDTDSMIALRALLKLPTGDVNNLTGSGAADVALWVEYGRTQLFGNSRGSLNAGAGVVALGEGDLLREAQEDYAHFAHLALTWQLTQRLVVLGQLDYHSQLLDTGLPQVAERALQGTLGGRWQFDRGWFGEFGLVEDLSAKSTSDVLFQLVLGVHL